MDGQRRESEDGGGGEVFSPVRRPRSLRGLGARLELCLVHACLRLGGPLDGLLAGMLGGGCGRGGIERGLTHRLPLIAVLIVLLDVHDASECSGEAAEKQAGQKSPGAPN